MFVEASWGVDPMDIHDIQHEWNKNHEENKLICHGLCGGYYSTRSIISLLKGSMKQAFLGANPYHHGEFKGNPRNAGIVNHHDIPMTLLMEEIRLTTLDVKNKKRPVNNEMNYQPQVVLAGCLPSTVLTNQ